MIKNEKKEGRWSNYVGEHQPHKEKTKTVKSRGRPQNMSEKIQFWSLDQRKLKKRGEGSKYVGEHWSCDN